MLLFFYRRASASRKILAAVLLLLSLACLNIFLMESGARYLSQLSEVLAYTIPLTIVMPIGPLIYFYTQANVDENFKWSRRQTIQLYPALIDLLPYLSGVALVVSRYLFGISNESEWNKFIDTTFIYIDVPRWISMTVYIFLSARLLTGAGNTRWKWIVAAFALFQLLWLGHLLLTQVNWYPLYVPLSLLVYWLSIHGFLSIKEKSRQARVPQDVAHVTASALTSAMERGRLFLDPDLGLNDIVKHLNIPQKTISATLNQHMELSFNEFVNSYRVDEFKKRLMFPDNDHLTLSGLALECGFNSQATFQRTFKKMTGQSPAEYLKTIRNTSQI